MSHHRDKRDSSSSNNLEPNILGYQLIGDSQFLRFSEQLLKKQRKKKNGMAYLGLCVSGQKIGDLLRRVRDDFYPTAKKAILMIGTNDLLQNTNISTMRNNLDLLLVELFTKGVTKLLLLTVPPVPRLASSYDHWYRLKEYNNHIKGRHDGDDIIVINVYPKFIKSIDGFESNRSSISSLNSCDFKRPSLTSSDSRRPSLTSSDSRRPSLNYSDSSRRSSINSCDSKRPSLTNSETKRRGISASSIMYPEEIASRMETPVKYKSNLRISIGEKRKVYELDRDNSTKDSSGESSPEFASPSPAKRRMYSSNLSLAEDDHDDTFADDDSLSQLNNVADEIRMDYFEEYFSRSSGRKDLIHFNYDGLRTIRQLILNEIEQ